MIYFLLFTYIRTYIVSNVFTIGSKAINVPNWESCFLGDFCANNWSCCIAPNDFLIGSSKTTCRPSNDCSSSIVPPSPVIQVPSVISNWETCFVGNSCANNWSCCVAPNDFLIGSTKTTCRPANDCSSGIVVADPPVIPAPSVISNWETCFVGNSCANNWSCCVAPNDFLIGSTKTTCRPPSDCSSSIIPQPISGSVIKKIADVLASYPATPNEAGDHNGFQYYEGGIYMSVLISYSSVTNDHSFDNKIKDRMAKESYYSYGSFVTRDYGIYNDDMLWWTIPSLQGHIFYGGNLPSGVSWLSVATKTFGQVYSQTDNVCGGGTYWTRDRSMTGGSYKASVNNAQIVLIASQLAILTNNAYYTDIAITAYNWLRSSYVIDIFNYILYDGVQTDNNCNIETNVYSYQVGVLIGGLVNLSKLTGDLLYIYHANRFFYESRNRWVNSNNIIVDYCEPNCSQNSVAPKGQLIRGWMLLYDSTNDDYLKQLIKLIITSSYNAMLNTCDINFNCGNYWAFGYKGIGVHEQMNALELAIAFVQL